jgi:hypothetical protein
LRTGAGGVHGCGQNPVKQYGVTIDQYHLPSGAQKLTLQPLPTQSNEQRFGAVQAAAGVDIGARFFFAASDGVAEMAIDSAATAAKVTTLAIDFMTSLPNRVDTLSHSNTADNKVCITVTHGLDDADDVL